MSGDHFVEVCVCGVVINQCRCMGPKVRRVSTAPCTHRQHVARPPAPAFKPLYEPELEEVGATD